MANESFCVSPLLNFTVAVSSYLPGASPAGRSKRSGMRSCWPVGNADRLAAGHGLRKPQRPTALASDRLAAVVDDDELLLDRFAGQEVVVLAGEGRPACRRCRPTAACCCAPGPRPPRWGSSPTLVGQVASARTARRDSRGSGPAVAGSPNPTLSSLRLLVRRRLAQRPEMAEYSQGELADMPQVRKARQLSVRYIGQDRVLVRRICRSPMACWDNPSGCQTSCRARNCLASQRRFFFFRLADLEGLVAEELGVPFGDAEFPRHRRRCRTPACPCTSRGTCAQSQVNGAPYSQVKTGFTPTVAQCSNQSYISWIGAQFG